MDIGVVSLEGLVGSSSSEIGGFVINPLSSSSSSSLDPDSKHKKCYGSGFLKQERSGIEDELLLWKGSKIARVDEEEQRNNNNNSSNNNNNNNSLLLLRSNNNDDDDDDNGQQQQQQMLSFSKLETLMVEKPCPNATLPCFYNTLSRNNNAGYSSGNNIMHGAIIRGAFTPSQWMELEHQALIYKYITANVPVPSHLLVPIRKALHSAAFSSFSNGLLRPNALGWGAFHLGYSNSTDPEPGRCRRTDGKKWRCSRDAVVDQKYCERHMNRGRHRSRKPVEGQSNGHALINPNTNNTNSSSSNNNNNNGNKINGSSASSSFSVVGLGNNASNNIISFGGHNQHSLASDASAANSINRVFMNHHHKHQIQYGEESSSSSSRNNNIEFGLVTSDSLLNPSQKSSSSTTTTTTTTTTLLTTSTFVSPSHNNTNNTDSTTTTESQQNHSLRNFMPLFTSSSQNNDEKVTLSPLRLSSRELELDPIQMGLGVGTCGGVNVNNTRQGNNWMIPITWESSMCGPLGEVLNLSNSNKNNNANANNNNNDKNSYSSGLNLMMSDGNWDNNNNNSPNSIGSSPSGVLMQKTVFGSVSNSSAGSSPRAENNNNNKVLHHHHHHQEGASLCNDDLLV